MTIIGHNFIGGSRSAQGTTLLKSIQATTGEALPYEFHHATEQEIIRPVKQPVKPLRLTAIPHLNSVLFF
ncbi:putative aldehyde dehydrogenase protein [Acinetobacter baumannii 135867]|nr:putative aldehyde dehydrogenase protein [Acinetobacter baumannii 135867]